MNPTSAARGALWAPALVLIGAALWGTTGTSQALAPAAATSVGIGGARIAVGALGLVVVALLSGGAASLRGFAAPGCRVATLSTMAAMAAYQLAFFAGVARAGVALGTVVGIGSAPVFTGVIAWLVRRERPTGLWFAATGCAIAGAALLLSGAGGARLHPLGLLLAAGAGASYAVFTVASKVLLTSGHGPEGTMAVSFAGGAVLLLPWLAGEDLSWVLTPRGAAVVGWLGLVTVAVAYLLFARGLRHLHAATVATLTLAEPLTAATLGIVLLAERPGPAGWVGGLLVLSGLVVLTLGPRLGSGRPVRRGRAPDDGSAQPEGARR